MYISSRFFQVSIISFSLAVISFFSWLNLNLYTSPNDGILYYSIALNIIDNFSFYSLMFRGDFIYTPQIGISFVLVPFIILFGDSWYLFFIIFLCLIWTYSLLDLSNSLKITIFKDSNFFQDKHSIFTFLLFICITSIMLVRISTSFYNESVTLPLQILIVSKFLLLTYENDKKNSTLISLVFMASLGIFFRLQFAIIYLALFFSLFLSNRLNIFKYLLSFIPIFIYFFLFYLLEQNFHVNTSTSEIESILDEIKAKIFYSINSLGIILNFYFFGLGNKFLILLIFPLIFLYFIALKLVRSMNKELFTFFLLTIIGNITFVILFIPVSFFDDPIRYYWHQLIPLTILIMISINHYLPLRKIRFGWFTTLFVIFSFSLGVYFHQNIFNKLEKSILSNNLKNIKVLNEKWNLSDYIIYSEDLRREFFWVSSKGTKSLSKLISANCNQEDKHFVLSKNEFIKYKEIDRVDEIRLFKVCI